MDKVNGKDFFKEFDRKKDEMYNLIQDSEEMVQEFNRMSDYVVSVISEKNQEFFNKSSNINMQKSSIKIEQAPTQESQELANQVQDELILPSTESIKPSKMSENTTPPSKEEDIERLVNKQFSHKEVSNNDLLDVGKSKLALNSRRREVLQMIEQGLSNDEISDKLKIGKGEIRLIRDLSR
jgi:DNA-binding NarL/FixJ family response regulator